MYTHNTEKHNPNEMEAKIVLRGAFQTSFYFNLLV